MEASQSAERSEIEQKDEPKGYNHTKVVAPRVNGMKATVSCDIMPVHSDSCDSNPNGNIVAPDVQRCQCLKTSESSYPQPPCYYCSSSPSGISSRNHSIPQIRVSPSDPAERRHSDQLLSRGFGSTGHSYHNPIFTFNYQVHESPGLPGCLVREDNTPSPTITELDKSKHMPRVAAIFCQHRLRKIFFSIPAGILSTLGIMGINASVTTIFNISILLIILVFYPLFCVLDFSIEQCSSRLKAALGKRQSCQHPDHFEEDPPRSTYEGDTRRRPRSLSFSSRLSVVSNLPSIAEEEDDDRVDDACQQVCSSSSVYERRYSECDCTPHMRCAHQTPSAQREIAHSVPQVIVQ